MPPRISPWYRDQEECFLKMKAEAPIEGITDAPISEKTILAFLQFRMYVVRDMDVISDKRILQQKVRALAAFMLKRADGMYQDPRRQAMGPKKSAVSFKAVKQRQT